MRTALAALTAIAMAVAGIAAAAVAIHRSHDGVPGSMRACAEDAGAVAVKARDGLGAARPDVLAGRRLPQRSWRMGRDRATLLQGADYAVLVVRAPRNPPLGSDVLRRVYRDPSVWALVAVERDPLRGVLADCVRRGT
ncbi:MAG: hypothetical protein QOG70_1300 [Solirubrobacteraceae bacterium]|nr:hypothetical protein [Solirubrobacteraceae bacterium]